MTGKKQSLSLETKKNILCDARAGILKKSAIAAKYGLPASTLSTILRNHEKIEAACAVNQFEPARKRMRSGKNKEIEDALLSWVREARSQNIILTGTMLQERAKFFGEVFGVGDFKCSNGWLSRFKERHGIVYNRIWGEESTTDQEWMNAAASKEGPHPLEPTVVIKEEPVEFEPTPSTSADPDCQIKEEFILPHEENAWTAADSRPSGVDPSSQATFSVACLGTDLNNTSSTSPVLDDPLKRKRKVNPSKLSVSGPSQKIARTLDSGTVSTEPFGNADNSSNPSSLNESKTSGPRPHDHFDAFGEYIAAKLRSLDKRSCAFAQKAIGDIIFDAEMGKFMEGAK